jgi:hypothetical protein
MQSTSAIRRNSKFFGEVTIRQGRACNELLSPSFPTPLPFANATTSRIRYLHPRTRFNRSILGLASAMSLSENISTSFGFAQKSRKHVDFYEPVQPPQQDGLFLTELLRSCSHLLIHPVSRWVCPECRHSGYKHLCARVETGRLSSRDLMSKHLDFAARTTMVLPW